MSDGERKQSRKKSLGTTFPPLKEVASKRGRPNKERKEKLLKASPQNVPLEEHPYMLWLADQWEDAEAEIGVLKRKQDDLKIAAHDFSESYPNKNIKPQNIGVEPV